MAGIRKDNYYYYINPQHNVVRRRGFMFTGFNPLAKYNVDIWIVVTSTKYVCFIGVNNIVVYSAPKTINNSRQWFVDKVEELFNNKGAEIEKVFNEKISLIQNLQTTQYHRLVTEWRNTHKNKGGKEDD